MCLFLYHDSLICTVFLADYFLSDWKGTGRVTGGVFREM